MGDTNHFRSEDTGVTRRNFIRLGATGAAALAYGTLTTNAESPPQLAGAITALEPYFTSQDSFRDVSRGKRVPHSLTEEQKRKVGLTS